MEGQRRQTQTNGGRGPTGRRKGREGDHRALGSGSGEERKEQRPGQGQQGARRPSRRRGDKGGARTRGGGGGGRSGPARTRRPKKTRREEAKSTGEPGNGAGHKGSKKKTGWAGNMAGDGVPQGEGGREAPRPTGAGACRGRGPEAPWGGRDHGGGPRGHEGYGGGKAGG